MAPDDATPGPAATAMTATAMTDPTLTDPTLRERALRERALRRLKRRRDLHAHLLVYVLVNTFIVMVWALTGAGFFWPAFPIVLWGIGVVMNAWDVYRGDEFSEESVAREMARLRRSA
jgi:hypothetical protein